MAYNVRRYIRHIDRHNVAHRIEIQQDGFSGNASPIDASGQDGIFTFDHEEFADSDDILKVYANPVQKGTLEVFPIIESSTDFELLEDIFGSDEDDFRLVWKQDGDIFWTGSVLPDLLEYPEDSYPFSATITAKDFSRLEGSDYSLTDSRQRIIATIADLINNLGYGLDIHTATSWTEENITAAEGSENYDFLNHTYHETKALREFARSGDESDQPITQYEALGLICRNFGLILRQEGNVFKLHQLTAYSDPASVLVATYDSAALQTQTPTATDFTENAKANDIVVTNQSVTRQYPALKKITGNFDHRTREQNVKFPESLRIQDSGVVGSFNSESFSQSFISTGDQRILFSGQVSGYETIADSEPQLDAEIYVEVQVDDVWWDGSSWVGTQQLITFPSTQGSIGPSQRYYIFNPSISTDLIPSNKSGLITITLYHGPILDTDGDQHPSRVMDYTDWYSLSYDLLNPASQTVSVHTNYELSQTGVWSEVYTYRDTWFGDGPKTYSPSALRYSSSDGDAIFEGWQRRGTTTGYRSLHENLFKEGMDVQRSPTKNIDAKIVGSYDSEKVLVYRSANYFYMGGFFDGYNGEWEPSLLEISISTASDDTFSTIPKYADEGSSGTSSTGGGGTSGGIDQDTGDKRWLNESSNLSDLDSAPDAISNLGITATAAELNILDGATLSTAELNLLDGVTATTAEINVVDGLTATTAELNTLDGITATTAELNILDGATLSTAELNQLDTNTFTSLTTHQGGIKTGDVRIESNSFALLELFRTGQGLTNPITFGQGPSGSLYIDVNEIAEGANSEILRVRADSFTNLFKIMGNGFVGIKTTPSEALDVNGNALFSGLTTHRSGINTGGSISFTNQSGVIDMLGGETKIRNVKQIEPRSDGLFRIEGRGDNSLFWVGYNNSMYFELFDGSRNQKFEVTPSGKVTARGGIEITSGNLAVNKTGATEALDVNGNIVNNGFIGADNFTTGSTGWQVSYAGDWEGNDGYYRGDLQVDGGLYAAEFIVEQTRVMTDFRMSVGGGRVKSVTGSAGTETVTLEDDFNNANPFAAGDIVLIQQRTGAFSGVIIKKIYREVASISGLDVTFQTTNITWTAGTDDTGSIAAGDDISVVGATTASASQATRDHYIHYDIAGVAIPAIRFFDGVNDVDAPTTDEIMRVGGLDPGGTNEFSSSLTGDIGVAGKVSGNLAFAVTDAEGLVGGANFDNQAMWSDGNSKTFKAAGLYLNWVDEDFSLGTDFYYDSSVPELGLTGTLLMGTGSDITNTNGDYSITESGITLDFATASGFHTGNTEKYIVWDDGSGNGFRVGAESVSNLATNNVFDGFFIEDTTNNIDILEYVKGIVDGEPKDYFSVIGFTNGRVESIADDDWVKIGEFTNNRATVIVQSNFATINWGMHAFTTDGLGNASHADVVIVSNSGSESLTTNNTPTGTTGTDGDVTIIANGDGELFLENRLGSEANFTYTIFT